MHRHHNPKKNRCRVQRPRVKSPSSGFRRYSSLPTRNLGKRVNYTPSLRPTNITSNIHPQSSPNSTAHRFPTDKLPNSNTVLHQASLFRQSQLLCNNGATPRRMTPRQEGDPSTLSRRMLTYWFQDYERGQVVPDHCRKKWFISHPLLDKYMVYEFGADFEAYRQEKLGAVIGPYTMMEKDPINSMALAILINFYPKCLLRLERAENSGFLSPEMVVTSQFGPTSRLAHEEFLGTVYNAIQMLHPLRFDVIERMFYFLPLLNVEQVNTQKIATARISDLLDEAPRIHRPFLSAVKDFSLAHLDSIQRFGRFPQRNAIMGRTNTPEEAEYLRLHCADWDPVQIFSFVPDTTTVEDQVGEAVENELGFKPRNLDAWKL